jgi:plastocyanin
VLVLSAATYGCTSLPETTRTATIHDVKVEDKLSAETVRVNAGDEIRWVNVRKLPVQVEVPSVKSEDLSCQRGFTNWMGSMQEIARLKPNETAALCFKKAGLFNYVVRAETSLGGGMQVLPGTVSVASPAVQ